ncbi:hypothetical protein AGMMS49587_19650 [Spirochaetia bacterium]|nr:hypothetical protein AGMMS49587_19650 [Spirochaetia bacterium]
MKEKKGILQEGGVWILVMAAVSIACAVLVTLLAERGENTFGLQWDLTQNRVYSISEATKGLLAPLGEDVTIYTTFSLGKEDLTISEILRRYRMVSRHIEIKNIDPVASPLFTRQFQKDDTAIGANSLIVALSRSEGENFRVIRAEDLYEWNLEGERLYATGLVVEQRVTSAILSLMGGEQQRAWFVEGHGEKNLETLYFLGGLLENDDFLVGSYNLVYNSTRLLDRDLLFFFAPARDLSDEEADTLERFLARGGKAVFFIDLFMADDAPNFSRILDAYGLKLRRELVVEADTGRYMGQPVVLAPVGVRHPAIEMLYETETYALMPRCRALDVVKRQGIENSPLFRTSAASFGKSNPLTVTLDREEGDTNGPFVLAAAAENKQNGSRVILFGSSDFISSIDAARSAGNLAVFMGGISWAADKAASVAIQPKSLLNPPLRIGSAGSMLALIALVIGALPAAVLIFGVSVWIRRVRA